MSRRTTIGIGGAASALVIGAGVFMGAGAASGGESDPPLTGKTLERASAAALAHAGGGTVVKTARGDEGGGYEVEVRRADGSLVEVQLSPDFAATGSEAAEDGREEGAGEGSATETASARTTVARTASTGGLPQGSEPVTLNPADFSTKIDNPYWPMSPGSRWVYRETDTSGKRQRVVITVTTKTKLIANGITARVIRDVATAKGKRVEATDDWYAQDKGGNIWYLGEDTKEYTNGKVSSTAGSFEAGVDGAQAGIAVPGRPVPGLTYRQEYYKGQAEDKAAVITVGQEQVEVPFGHFARRVLMTRDLVPLEPKVQELKFYAPGIGPVLSVHTDGAGGRSELVSHTRG